jgi:glycosyltransferase involved in cell wall biosynthesis
LNALKSIRSDPKIHLLIMGFPNVEKYSRLSHELGVADCVTFTGVISYYEAHRMLAVGDIAVGPKISETEGSGKLLNYMAMGLPTVAFDMPVSREYLGDAGVLIPLGDINAFSTALARLARDPAERSARGAELRRRAVDHFPCAVAVDVIESVYDAHIKRVAGRQVDSH